MSVDANGQRLCGHKWFWAANVPPITDKLRRRHIEIWRHQSLDLLLQIWWLKTTLVSLLNSWFYRLNSRDTFSPDERVWMFKNNTAPTIFHVWMSILQLNLNIEVKILNNKYSSRWFLALSRFWRFCKSASVNYVLSNLLLCSRLRTLFGHKTSSASETTWSVLLIM